MAALASGAIPPNALLAGTALLAGLVAVCVVVSAARYDKWLEPLTFGQAEAQRDLPDEARPKLSLFACPNSTMVRPRRAGAQVA